MKQLSPRRTLDFQNVKPKKKNPHWEEKRKEGKAGVGSKEGRREAQGQRLTSTDGLTRHRRSRNSEA